MKKKKCRVLMAIDASGSMYDLAGDVRGGFNQYVDDLNDDYRWRVNVVLFNTHARPLCTDARPGEVPRLDETNYSPMGGTALLDAIGRLVTSVEGLGDDDERVLVVVNTDGEENSSREWTLPGVQKLIEDRRATGRWGFVFLGASPESWRQGNAYGFASGQTLNTSGGTRSAYSAANVGTYSFASGGSDTAVAAAASAASMAADDEEAGGGN